MENQSSKAGSSILMDLLHFVRLWYTDAQQPHPPIDMLPGIVQKLAGALTASVTPPQVEQPAGETLTKTPYECVFPATTTPSLLGVTVTDERLNRTTEALKVTEQVKPAEPEPVEQTPPTVEPKAPAPQITLDQLKKLATEAVSVANGPKAQENGVAIKTFLATAIYGVDSDKVTPEQFGAARIAALGEEHYPALLAKLQDMLGAKAA